MPRDPFVGLHSRQIYSLSKKYNDSLDMYKFFFFFSFLRDKDNWTAKKIAMRKKRFVRDLSACYELGLNTSHFRMLNLIQA